MFAPCAGCRDSLAETRCRIPPAVQAGAARIVQAWILKSSRQALRTQQLIHLLFFGRQAKAVIRFLPSKRMTSVSEGLTHEDFMMKRLNTSQAEASAALNRRSCDQDRMQLLDQRLWKHVGGGDYPPTGPNDRHDPNKPPRNPNG